MDVTCMKFSEGNISLMSVQEQKRGYISYGSATPVF